MPEGGGRGSKERTLPPLTSSFEETSRERSQASKMPGDDPSEAERLRQRLLEAQGELERMKEEYSKMEDTLKKEATEALSVEATKRSAAQKHIGKLVGEITQLRQAVEEEAERRREAERGLEAAERGPGNAAAAARPVSKVKVPSLESTDQANWEDFKIRMKRVIEANRWSDRDAREQLMTAFSGTAARVTEDVDIQGKTYAELLRELDELFSTPAYAAKARLEMKRTLQQENQSAHVYRLTLWSLSKKADPHLTNEQRDKDPTLVETFQGGLRLKEVRDKATQKPNPEGLGSSFRITSLKEAAEAASQAEQMIGLSLRQEEEQQFIKASTGKPGMTPTPTLKTLNAVYPEAEMGPGGRRWAGKPGCRECGSLRHMEAECPDRERREDRSRGSRSSGRRRSRDRSPRRRERRRSGSQRPRERRGRSGYGDQKKINQISGPEEASGIKQEGSGNE